jgi:hypothetical protein
VEQVYFQVAAAAEPAGFGERRLAVAAVGAPVAAQDDSQAAAVAEQDGSAQAATLDAAAAERDELVAVSAESPAELVVGSRQVCRAAASPESVRVCSPAWAASYSSAAFLA